MSIEQSRRESADMLDRFTQSSIKWLNYHETIPVKQLRGAVCNETGVKVPTADRYLEILGNSLNGILDIDSSGIVRLNERYWDETPKNPKRYPSLKRINDFLQPGA